MFSWSCCICWIGFWLWGEIGNLIYVWEQMQSVLHLSSTFWIFCEISVNVMLILKIKLFYLQIYIKLNVLKCWYCSVSVWLMCASLYTSSWGLLLWYAAWLLPLSNSVPCLQKQVGWGLRLYCVLSVIIPSLFPHSNEPNSWFLTAAINFKGKCLKFSLYFSIFAQSMQTDTTVVRSKYLKGHIMANQISLNLLKLVYSYNKKDAVGFSAYGTK